MKDNNALKSTISTQKSTHEEILHQEKLRILNEEEKKQHDLDNRLRSSITSKEELEVIIILIVQYQIYMFYSSYSRNIINS